MFGALPSRIARRSTGSASPSISRKTIPGASVRTGAPDRRAIRWIDADRVLVVVVRPEDDLEHDARPPTATSAASSAHQKRVDVMRRRVIASAASSISASSDEHEQEAERRA